MRFRFQYASASRTTFGTMLPCVIAWEIAALVKASLETASIVLGKPLYHALFWVSSTSTLKNDVQSNVNLWCLFSTIALNTARANLC